MKQVTEKNTKKEILEVLEEAKAIIEGKKISTIADVKEEARVTKVKETAKEMIELGILNEETVQKYKSLLEAISIAESTLKTLLESEKEIYDFETIKLAKETVVADLETEIENKKIEMKNVIQELELEFKNKKASLEKEIADFKKEQDQARSREKEEFAYNLKRERTLEENIYLDKKALKEKALKDAELAFETKLAALEEREKAIEELETKVAAIPELIAEATEQAAKEAKTQASISYNAEVAYIKKANDLDIKAKDNEIVSLTKQIAIKDEKINELEDKLENAYNKMNDLAVKIAQKENSVTIKNETVK